MRWLLRVYLLARAAAMNGVRGCAIKEGIRGYNSHVRNVPKIRDTFL